jgi:hypothetical protein
MDTLRLLIRAIARRWSAPSLQVPRRMLLSVGPGAPRDPEVRGDLMREILDAACAFCGKSVVSDRGRVDVREGEKVFHLDCYRLYKRRPSKSN